MNHRDGTKRKLNVANDNNNSITRRVWANFILDSAKRTLSSDAPVNKSHRRGVPFTTARSSFRFEGNFFEMSLVWRENDRIFTAQWINSSQLHYHDQFSTFSKVVKLSNALKKNTLYLMTFYYLILYVL